MGDFPMSIIELSALTASRQHFAWCVENSSHQAWILPLGRPFPCFRIAKWRQWRRHRKPPALLHFTRYRRELKRSHPSEHARRRTCAGIGLLATAFHLPELSSVHWNRGPLLALSIIAELPFAVFAKNDAPAKTRSGPFVGLPIKACLAAHPASFENNRISRRRRLHPHEGWAKPRSHWRQRRNFAISFP